MTNKTSKWALKDKIKVGQVYLFRGDECAGFFRKDKFHYIAVRARYVANDHAIFDYFMEAVENTILKSERPKIVGSRNCLRLDRVHILRCIRTLDQGLEELKLFFESRLGFFEKNPPATRFLPFSGLYHEVEAELREEIKQLKEKLNDK